MIRIKPLTRTNQDKTIDRVVIALVTISLAILSMVFWAVASAQVVAGPIMQGDLGAQGIVTLTDDPCDQPKILALFPGQDVSFLNNGTWTEKGVIYQICWRIAVDANYIIGVTEEPKLFQIPRPAFKKVNNL